MGRKYIETSFTSFVKHKLHETIKSEEIEKPKEIKNTKPNEDEPDEEGELAKDKKKSMASNEYVSELQREFNKIWDEYDSLYGV